MNIKNRFIEFASHFLNRNHFTRLEVNWKVARLLSANRFDRYDGIAEHLGVGFKAYLEQKIRDDIHLLKQNLDETSCRLADEVVKDLLHLPGESFAGALFIVPERMADPERLRERRRFYRKLRGYCREYRIPPRYCSPEVFHFHHGLRALPEAVHNYIRDTVFVDAGAFVGDSALMLIRHYRPSQVWSFEASPEWAKPYRALMERNRIDPGRYEFIPYALGNRNSSKNQTCPMLRLDSFRPDAATRIGFVKADIEGGCLAMMRGMTEVLRRDRPILSLAIYHNPEEFFGVKPFLENLELGYEFRLRRHAVEFNIPLQEITLLAIPREII